MTSTATSTANLIRRRRWSNQRGASMIETVVALGLFGIVAASMSGFLTHQVRRSSANHLSTIAYDLAESALETARAGNIGDLTSSSKTVSEGNMTFTVATQVQDDTPSVGLKTVNARVTWKDQLGTQQIDVPAVYTEVRRF